MTEDQSEAVAPAEVESDPVVARLREQFGERIVETVDYLDQLAITVAPDDLVEVARFLKHDPSLRFEQLSDVCGVDNLRRDVKPRFYSIYHLRSPLLARWIRLRVPLADREPTAPSLVSLWPGASWPEREAFDLYGIKYDGHPALTRILMPDDWQGYPLRKDDPFTPEEVEYSFNMDQVNAGRVVKKGDPSPEQWVGR